MGKQVSSHDRFLQKLQALSADSTSPLVKLLSDIHEGKSPSTSATLEQAIQLICNLHARLTRVRRGCVLRGIHPSLQHMESEEFLMGEHLFGKVHCLGSGLERADELKILSIVKTQSAQFYLKGQWPRQRSLWSSVSHKRKGTTLPPPTPNSEILSIPPLKAKVLAF